MKIKHDTSSTAESDIWKRSLVDWDNVVSFGINLSQACLNDYYDVHLSDPGFNSSNLKRRDHTDGSLRSFVVSNAMARDLARFSTAALVANLISQSGCYEPEECYTAVTSRTPHIGKVRLYIDYERYTPDTYTLRCLDIGEVFRFLSDACADSNNGGFSQLQRGLNYFLNGIGHQNQPITRIVWCISALEALLTKPTETGTRALLEARINAIYDGKNKSWVTGKFRALYKFRSEFLHGARDIDTWVVDSGPFIDSDSNSRDWAYGFHDESATAVQLCVKILQRFFELKLTSTSFDTTLAGTDSKS